MTKLDFINEVAKYVCKYAKHYGICNNAVPIAQAILESGFGSTELAVHANNYFGLKAGKSWTGATITIVTTECINGNYVKVTDTFRKYASLEECVKGYFEFLQYDRYSNLKGVVDNHIFVELLKQDGYATDERYISKIITIIDTYDLSQYNAIGTMLTDLVVDTYRGKYGNGETRKKNLGCHYSQVQSYVNIVSDAIKGRYGNGGTRAIAIRTMGYDYNIVQTCINKIMKG